MKLGVKTNKIISFVLCIIFMLSCTTVCYAQDADENKEVIVLSESEKGVGIFEAQENMLFKSADALIAEYDQEDGVFRASRDTGDELVLLSVGDDLYQAVDEIVVSKENVEEIILDYDLHQIIAQDLRDGVAHDNTLTVYLPSRASTFTIDRGNPIYYDYTYNGQKYQMERSVLNVNPNPAVEWQTIARSQYAGEVYVKQAAVVGVGIAGLISQPVALGTFSISLLQEFSGFKYYGYSSDYIQAGLQEMKRRTYISVNEAGAYLPRVMHDQGKVGFKLRCVSNGVEREGFSGYYNFGITRSSDFLNTQAAGHYGSIIGETMYREIYSRYRFADTNIWFESELPH